MAKTEGKRLVRADLDGATLAVVDIEQALPFIRQRIEQAIRRGGMDALLSPALEDITRIMADTASAKHQIKIAIERMFPEKK